MAGEIAGALRPFLTRERADRIEQILEGRLNGIQVLLEGPYDHGNIAAIMRSCEAFGVQTVHLADLPETYKPARKPGLSAHKWLTLWVHDRIEQAVDRLRSQGFRLTAADPKASRTLEELTFTGRTALVFGAEKEGITGDLLGLCDETYRIPMVGQTQSLNVSCAASIALYEATRRYRLALGRLGDLTDEEKERVRRLFYRRAVRFSDLILAARGEEGER
ncbi:MAG: RNA methyltransferase [Bradymonadales bacterium]|nr:RNA methyltransferase [Bradymonadales bacterium]